MSALLRLARALAGALVVVVALAGSALAHLDTRAGRALVKTQLLPRVNDALPGRLEVGSVDALGLGGVRLRDVAIRGPEGRVVIAARALQGELAPLALLRGTLRFERVDVFAPRVRLDTVDGELRLTRAFVEPGAEDGEGGGSPLPIVLDTVRVHGGRVLPDPAWQPSVALHALDLEGQLRVDDSVRLRAGLLPGARPRLRDGRGRLAELEGIDARLDLRAGQASGASVVLASPAGARVRVRGAWVAPSDSPDPADGAASWGRARARVETDPLPPRWLARLVPQEWPLVEPVALRARARLEGRRIAGRAELASDAGSIEATVGRALAGVLHLDARTSGLDLAGLVGEGPRVRGRVAAAARFAERRTGITAALLGGRVDAWPLPALRAEAVLGEDALTVLALDAPGLTGAEGHLDAHARVALDGSRLEGRLDAFFPALARLPGLDARGRARLRASVDLARGAAGGYRGYRGEAHARATLRGLAYAGLGAEHLDLDADARGVLDAPRVDLRVGAARVRAPAVRLARVDARVHGAGPYAFSLDAAGAVEGLPTLPGRAPAPASGLPAPRDEPSSAAPSSAAPSSAAPAPLALHAEGQLARRADAIEGDARLRLEGLWPHPLHLRLERLHAGARRVAVRHLRAQARGLRLTASGAYRLAARRLDAEARLDHFDLARVARLLGRPLAGTLEADARFDGPLSPDAGARASLTARGEQLRVAGVRVPSAGVALHQDGPVARLRAVATLPAGSVGLDAQGKALVGASVVAAPTRTYWRADVHAHRLDHAALAELLPGAPPLEGQSEVALQLAGELPLPAARLRWRARRARVVLPDTPVDPVDLALRAELDHDRLAATLESADRHGDLATLRARLPEALLLALAEAPAAGPTDAAGRPGAESPSAASLTPHAPLARLREHPWELELLLAPRRLDQLPAPLDPGLPPSAPDATLGGELRVGRRPGEPLTLRAVVRGDLAPMLASDARCAPGGDTHARVVAHLRDPGGPTLDRLDAEAKLAVTAGPGEPALAGGVARAALPLGAWLAGRPARPPGAHATLHTEGVDLGRLPFVCREARGTLRGELALRDAFTDAPSARLDLAVDDLDVGAGAPFALSLEGSAEDGRLAGELLLRERGQPRPRVTLSARAPLRWTEPLPTLADGPLEADARLDDAPLAALLFAVPGVDRPGGTLAGELHAEGRSLEDAALRGELSLTEVQLALASGQRFEDLHGRLLFEPDAWRVRELHTEDLDGHATVDGRVSVDGLLPTGADLQVDLDEYPLRLEGLVYARLDGRAALDADLDATPARADLRLEDLDVALPGSLPDELMALEDHPRVLYEGEPGYAADSVEAALEAARGAAAGPDDTSSSPYLPLVLELRSAEPFWVRRSDFAVQAELDLEARIEAGGVALVGPVDIRRGNVTLLGRGFDLEPGTLRFDGGRRVDPLVDVAAVHRLNGGDTVTIDIEGRALAPELSFRTSVPGVATDRGVLELLVRGRRGASEADAQSQALSFLTGLTGGLLTDLTQRRAGEYVPVLSIESQAGGETRLRAGFAADELIPEGWEDVIQGAYVEGFVGAQSGEGAGTRATGGVLLELLFPRDLVGTATFQEGSQWSVDLQWEP